jgi:hypothetical protein
LMVADDCLQQIIIIIFIEVWSQGLLTNNFSW